MPQLAPLFSWIQNSSVATLVSQTSLVNACLSSLHLVGGTLLVGGVLVSSLRLMGAVLRDRPAAEVTGAMRIGILIGLALNIVTGLLMVSPRITDAAGNWIFQSKMALLVAGVLFHFGWYRAAARGRRPAFLPGLPAGAVGAIGLALWVGVLAAGVGFILLE
jgi:Family of unknown function (DUF6644)